MVSIGWASKCKYFFLLICFPCALETSSHRQPLKVFMSRVSIYKRQTSRLSKSFPNNLFFTYDVSAQPGLQFNWFIVNKLYSIFPGLFAHLNHLLVWILSSSSGSLFLNQWVGHVKSLPLQMNFEYHFKREGDGNLTSCTVPAPFHLVCLRISLFLCYFCRFPTQELRKIFHWSMKKIPTELHDRTLSVCGTFTFSIPSDRGH